MSLPSDSEADHTIRLAPPHRLGLGMNGTEVVTIDASCACGTWHQRTSGETAEIAARNAQASHLRHLKDPRISAITGRPIADAPTSLASETEPAPPQATRGVKLLLAGALIFIMTVVALAVTDDETGPGGPGGNYDETDCNALIGFARRDGTSVPEKARALDEYNANC